MNDERIHAVEAFYDFHPISLTQILQALEAKGIKLDKIKPCDLLPHDQDHYGGVAAVDRIIAHAALSSDDQDRKSTRLNSSHVSESRMPSSA